MAFTSSDTAAVLPADDTLTDGVGTFTVTLETAGSQTLTATDTVNASLLGTSSSLTVSAAAATHFVLTAPATATAGTPLTFTVTAEDQYGNTATGYTGTVGFTSSDTAAVLPADHALLTDGVGTFTATLETAGSQTLTATDTVTASLLGTSSSITVSAAAATHFVLTAPATATAGTSFSFTVTAEDQYGNTATGYTGTVAFTSSDTAAVLPANYTFVAADDGVHTFTGATLETAGSQTLTATDTVNASLLGTSSSITVSAAAATHFVVTAPATATAGTPLTFTVTAEDQYGNTATAYTGTVGFTSSDTAAVLPADATLTDGVGTFTATLETAANQTLTATDTVNASLLGTSSSITVSAAAATHFVLTAPATATAGTAVTFTVTADDQYGNTATGYTGTVHFTSSGTAAVLPADTTLTDGVGTFTDGATLETAGSQTLTATDTVNASLLGTSSSITVTAAIPVGTGSLSGYVYYATDGDAQQTTADPGMAGVTVRLYSENSSGNFVEVSGSPVQTGPNGSYSFQNLPAGTYQIEAFPASFLTTGTANVGTVGGATDGTAVAANKLQVQLGDGQSGSDYNFPVTGLQSSYISLRLFLASTPPMQDVIAGMYAPAVISLSGNAATYTTGGAAVDIFSEGRRSPPATAPPWCP